MSTSTTKPLSDSVGAEVLDVDRDRLLHDDALGRRVPRGSSTGTACSCSASCTSTTTTQVAFSRQARHGGGGRHAATVAEIFRVTLDPAKNPAADYLKGTFDWHIDGMTDDIPIMATVLSAHEVAASGGDTEFASTYAAYDDLSDDEQGAGAAARGWCTPSWPRRGCHIPNRRRDGARDVEQAPAEDAPAGLAARVGRESLVLGATDRPRRGHGARTKGARISPTCSTWSTVPERVYRHEWAVGDLVIWDNRGVLHRATRYDPSSARDMHRTTIAGDEAVQ